MAKSSRQELRQNDDADECERLTIQVRHTGVVACLAQASLRHHRPLEFAERAVRADHFDRLFAFLVRESNGFRIVPVPAAVF